MSVQVPPDVEANIRQIVERGRYHDATEVIRTAVRLLDVRDQQLERLRASVEAGFAAIERGEGIELTRELMDEIEREAEERARRGEQPNPDVCP